MNNVLEDVKLVPWPSANDSGYRMHHNHWTIAPSQGWHNSGWTKLCSTRLPIFRHGLPSYNNIMKIIRKEGIQCTLIHSTHVRHQSAQRHSVPNGHMDYGAPKCTLVPSTPGIILPEGPMWIASMCTGSTSVDAFTIDLRSGTDTATPARKYRAAYVCTIFQAHVKP